MSCVTKCVALPPSKPINKCSSYKHFDEKVFSEAVSVPFDTAYVSDGEKDTDWSTEILLSEVLHKLTDAQVDINLKMFGPLCNHSLQTRNS
jgi:hypothetical protein